MILFAGVLLSEYRFSGFCCLQREECKKTLVFPIYYILFIINLSDFVFLVESIGCLKMSFRRIKDSYNIGKQISYAIFTDIQSIS